ncbi:hypothetical protein HAX54_013980, partial [Datura stramonium]|nr:hypothetical protein [Datura stramonium]
VDTGSGDRCSGGFSLQHDHGDSQSLAIVRKRIISGTVATEKLSPQQETRIRKWV